jgi:protein phosphatase
MSGYLETVGMSDAGAVRQYNEDRIVVAPDLGLMALADGMGGHRAGEVASQLAVEALVAHLKSRLPLLTAADRPSTPRMLLDESINQANRVVYEAGQRHVAHHGMGTTLAVALFHDNRVALGHLGDSRVYRLRGQVLELLTRDDSLLREEVDAGLIAADEAADSHNRSLITRALGGAARVRPHLREVDALPGDLFLLCSDGLNDLVGDDDIELILASLWVNLPLAAEHLVQAAKDRGGFDNVSVILARVRQPFPASRGGGLLDRILRWLGRG